MNFSLAVTAVRIPYKVCASVEIQVNVYTVFVVLVFWLVEPENIHHFVFSVELVLADRLFGEHSIALILVNFERTPLGKFSELHDNQWSVWHMADAVGIKTRWCF